MSSASGKKWNFPWFSYVTLGPFGTNNIVHFSSGMTRTFAGSTDYLTNVRLTGDMTNGYTLYYPDGSLGAAATCISASRKPRRLQSLFSTPCFSHAALQSAIAADHIQLRD